MKRLLFAFGLQATALAAPVFHEDANSLRIVAENYTVELSAHGALTRIEIPGMGNVYDAASADPDAWVFKAGEEWVSSRAIPVLHSSTTEPEGLRVAFVYNGKAGGGEYEIHLEYSFRNAFEFTLNARVENIAGPTVELIAVPAPSRVDGVPLQEIIFPFRSGIVVLPPEPGTELSTTIPSGFTDFVHFQTHNGGFSISELVDTRMPTDHGKRLALYHSHVGGSPRLGYHIDRSMALASGETWVSDTTLFQVGRGGSDAARRHWEAGSTGQYPKLDEKLSSTVFDSLSRSVLFKYPDGFGEPFIGPRIRDTLSLLPSPALLHLCGYMPGGHDSNYPDYLPPYSALGTMDELKEMVRALRERGILVMPYTNPTWWQTDSPTVVTSGSQIAMKESLGLPLVESYHNRSGIVVDPAHPAVLMRQQQTTLEFTKVLPIDFLFEDQVGARDWIYGHGRKNPWSYSADLLRGTVMSGSIPLMTEGGWDRLVKTQIGFCGNGTLDWEQPKLPPGTWLSYPLMQIMAHGHVATYPHNLAGEKMVHDREQLLHNVAFGYNLAYDLNRGESEWMGACIELQGRVLHRTFGTPIKSFTDKRSSVGWSHLVYTSGDEVFANWSDNPVPWRTHVVAARGFAFISADNSVAAGYFDLLDGHDLSDHPRLVIREGAETEVLLGAPLKQERAEPESDASSSP